MSAPDRLSADLGCYDLRRGPDGRFRDRAAGLEARVIPGFAWGLRFGSNPHCWWLAEQPGGARGRLWLEEKVIAIIDAPGGPQGERITLILERELDGPFAERLAGISVEIAQAIIEGWNRPR